MYRRLLREGCSRTNTHAMSCAARLKWYAASDSMSLTSQALPCHHKSFSKRLAIHSTLKHPKVKAHTHIQIAAGCRLCVNTHANTTTNAQNQGPSIKLCMRLQGIHHHFHKHSAVVPAPDAYHDCRLVNDDLGCQATAVLPRQIGAGCN